MFPLKPSFIVDFPIKAFIYTGFPKIMEDVPRAFFQIHIFTSADRGSRFLARTSRVFNMMGFDGISDDFGIRDGSINTNSCTTRKLVGTRVLTGPTPKRYHIKPDTAPAIPSIPSLHKNSFIYTNIAQPIAYAPPVLWLLPENPCFCPQPPVFCRSNPTKILHFFT